MIKPLLVNTYDAIGGAIAARAERLHQGLLRLRIDSKKLFASKFDATIDSDIQDMIDEMIGL